MEQEQRSQTIQQWLRQLSQPYRDEALYNANNVNPNGMHSLEPSLAAALNESFNWSETQQGHDYWNQVYNAVSSYPIDPHFATLDTQSEHSGNSGIGMRVIDWFKLLKEPFRSQAIQGMNSHHTDNSQLIRNSIHNALDSFTWSNTVEGHTYWSKICDALVKNPLNPNYIGESVSNPVHKEINRRSILSTMRTLGVADYKSGNFILIAIHVTPTISAFKFYDLFIDEGLMPIMNLSGTLYTAGADEVLSQAAKKTFRKKCRMHATPEYKVIYYQKTQVKPKPKSNPKPIVKSKRA